MENENNNLFTLINKSLSFLMKIVDQRRSVCFTWSAILQRYQYFYTYTKFSNYNWYVKNKYFFAHQNLISVRIHKSLILQT